MEDGFRNPSVRRSLISKMVGNPSYNVANLNCTPGLSRIVIGRRLTKT